MKLPPQSGFRASCAGRCNVPVLPAFDGRSFSCRHTRVQVWSVVVSCACAMRQS